jgi:membrane fusion protein
VAAQQSGMVLERRVMEGQHVEAGDTLMVINIERQSLGKTTVENTAEAVSREIRQRQGFVEMARRLGENRIRQQRDSATAKIGWLDVELAQVEESIQLQQSKVVLEQSNVERLKPLVTEGYIPQSKLAERQAASLDTMSQLQNLIRNRTSLQRDRDALHSELDALAAELRAEDNTLNAQRSTLKQEELEVAARRTLVVSAPSAGTVSGLEIRAGQSVQAGQALATILPDTKGGNKLEAHLFAPSRTAGFVQPGQDVFVRYAAYPYQKFGMYPGHIKAVSVTPFSPNELPPNLSQQVLAQTGSVEGLYRISVELEDQTISAYGNTIQLKPGFVLEADVVQARMKIWELIFEPLLAVRAQMRLTKAPAGAGKPSV